MCSFLPYLNSTLSKLSNEMKITQNRYQMKTLCLKQNQKVKKGRGSENFTTVAKFATVAEIRYGAKIRSIANFRSIEKICSIENFRSVEKILLFFFLLF